MEWAIDGRGALPAKQFFDGLRPEEQAKFLALFKRLAHEGRITNPEHFKSVERTGLFEFKKHQLRFLGNFRPGGRFLIAYGLRKKKDKLDREDIEKAQRILEENDTREGRT